jgi:hypothetical protein
MKKFIKIGQYVLTLALVIFFITVVFFKKHEPVVVEPVIDTGSVEFLFSGFITTGEVEEVVPTT